MADGMLAMMAAKDERPRQLRAAHPEATTPTTFREWCEDTLKPAVRPSREIPVNADHVSEFSQRRSH